MTGNPTLDTRTITRASVRSELANASAEAVALYMYQRGWGFEGQVRDAGFGKACYYTARFSKWSWGAVPCGASVGYGFSTPDLSGLGSVEQRDEMVWATRRAAELCLQVEVLFADALPANPDIYGIVKPEPAYIQDSWSESKPRFSDPVYLAERQRDRDSRLFKGDFLFEQNGFFHLVVQGREVLLTRQDLDKLESQLSCVREKQNGLQAI